MLGASRKDFLPVFVLLLNALTWYGMTFLMVDKFQKAFNLPSEETVRIWVIYFVSIIGSSVVGSILSKIRRRPFLYMWMILGTVSSLLPILLNSLPFVWSSVLGFSLGVGMPACLAYFADFSTVENRGRRSGITFLVFYLSAAILNIAFGLFDLTVGFIFLAIWRATGLLLFILLKPEEPVPTEKNRDVAFTEVLKDRSLRLYLVPLIMFILIDRFEKPVLASYLTNPSLSSAVILGPIVGSLASFFGGLFSDRVGRKRVVIGGFVAMGLAYALIGIRPDMPISWYFYSVADGVAWGILFVTFLLIIWGDLSQVGGREKYYVIGGTPFYFSRIMEVLVTSYVGQISEYAAFSLASFFLFIAILPLLYAPETLPQKHIELRRLRGYIEQATKIREKSKTQ